MTYDPDKDHAGRPRLEDAPRLEVLTEALGALLRGVQEAARATQDDFVLCAGPA